jgi:hypothetical protein
MLLLLLKEVIMIRKLLGRIEDNSFLRCLVLQRNLLLVVAKDNRQEGMFQLLRRLEANMFEMWEDVYWSM